MENDIIKTIKTELKINPPLFSLLDKSTYTYLTSNKEIEMGFMFNVSHFLKKKEPYKGSFLITTYFIIC